MGGCRAETAIAGQNHQRHQHQRHDHDTALDKIGQADGEKTANHSIGQYDARGQPYPGHIIAHAGVAKQAGKAGLEQFAAADQARCGIDGEEQNDDDRRCHPQRQRLVGETIGEKFGDGEGVAIAFCLLAQTRGNDDPVDQRADKQADPDPHLYESRRIKRARQAEQQPARHIGCSGRQRCHRRMEVPAPQQIAFATVGGFAPGVKSDGEHQDEIQGE